MFIKYASARLSALRGVRRPSTLSSSPKPSQGTGDFERSFALFSTVSVPEPGSLPLALAGHRGIRLSIAESDFEEPTSLLPIYGRGRFGFLASFQSFTATPGSVTMGDRRRAAGNRLQLDSAYLAIV